MPKKAFFGGAPKKCRNGIKVVKKGLKYPFFAHFGHFKGVFRGQKQLTLPPPKTPLKPLKRPKMAKNDPFLTLF